MSINGSSASDASRAHCQRGERPYQLLPFDLFPFDDARYVLTNLVGEHLVVAREVLIDLVGGRLESDSPYYTALESRHFLFGGGSTVALDLLATKYRTKQSVLQELTGLFVFVVTLRCDQECTYCQASRRGPGDRRFDMSMEHADRAVDFMFGSPSKALKVEFQGGEPLLNFDVVRRVVERAERRNLCEGRDLSFVLATNLGALKEEHLAFCAEHRIVLSTSLDGPEDLHNRNRPRPSSGSHARTVDGIARARAALGHDAVSALMTTTAESLSRGRDVVDEYARLGFESIFLRCQRPYGLARHDHIDTDQWLEFYRIALSRILELNHSGTRMREEFASIILRKALTPFPTRYVDLQSPAALGIGCVAINYDGAIYASDESRMLAETGDETFRLGHVDTDSFASAIGSDHLLELLHGTMLEGVPMCADCAFRPYCGADPVYHHAVEGDLIGFKPTSADCRRNMGVMRHLFALLEDSPADAQILQGWAV